MLTIKRKIVLALVAITLTCLVPTLAFGQDSVLSIKDSGTYNVGFFVNGRSSLASGILHVINPGSTGGFETDPTKITGGDLCANIYVLAPDQELAECCSCKVSPNGMQSFAVDADLIQDPVTPAVPSRGAIKIVSSFGGGKRGAGLPPTLDFSSTPPACDAGSDYWPQGRLESWISHNRPLGAAFGAASTTTEIDFQGAQLSWSELKKLQQECFANTAPPGEGGNGNGHGVCRCDPAKTF
jgi:hypothetical protein